MLKSLLRSIGRPQTPPAERTLDGPRANVPESAQQRYTFAADGLSTVHDASFLKDPRFQASYRLGAASGHRICKPEDLHIEWRVYVCCWAASHALRLPGDFVECGVSTGIVSRAVANYVSFDQQDRRFWLIDTFDGIPLDQATAQEQALAQSKNARHYYDCYADVQSHFSRYRNVNVIKGKVPDVLDELEFGTVSYLHIDMNIAEPEVDAIRFFWDRLTIGAVVVFDDYGSLAHGGQKLALDAFASSIGVTILALPTGQGLLLKS